MVSFDLRTKHSSQLNKHRKGDLKDNYTLPIKVVLHQTMVEDVHMAGK